MQAALPNEPRWLPIEAIIKKNQREEEETGERHFLRDVALFEATSRCSQNAFAFGEEDVVALAVQRLVDIAKLMFLSRVLSARLFGAM